MLIPKENRRKIYEYLFQEGTLVAKKDFNAPKHQDIDVLNLQVRCTGKLIHCRSSRRFNRSSPVNSSLRDSTGDTITTTSTTKVNYT